MRFFIPKTVKGRLVLSHLLVAAVSFSLISIFAVQAMSNAARVQMEQNVEDLAFGASNALEEPLMDLHSGRGTVDQVQAAMVPFISNEPDLEYSIYLPDGALLVDTRENLPSQADPATDPEIWEALESTSEKVLSYRLDEQGIETLYLATRVGHSDQTYGVLLFEIPRESALNLVRRSIGLLLFPALLVVLGVGAGAYLLARSLSKSIENLTQTAVQIAHGDLEARSLTPEAPQELHRLAEAFNKMASRYQTNMNELRSFASNASHEIRTPLTIIKLRIEALRQGALEDPEMTDQFLAEVESEVDRLSSMVGDMLDLSRIEAGLSYHENAVLDLNAIAKDVYETFEVRAKDAGITLNYTEEPGTTLIWGKEDQLRRMLYNLVDNAIKYTTHGGCVDLLLQTGEQDKTVRVVVKDTGFGIANAHLPHIFERFFRAEATRPRHGPGRGSGLGLAIAKTIAENHAGKIWVESQAGTGSTFSVELPTLQNASSLPRHP